MIFDIRRKSDTELLCKAFTGKKVGLTSGSFDLFHHMHLVYLERCSRLCDVLIVGVDSNDLVRLRKGADRPIVPEHQRIAIVSSLYFVNAAFVLGTVEDFQLAAELLGAEVIFKNDAFTEEEVLGREQARVVIIPDLAQHSSTTQIIEEIIRRKTRSSSDQPG